MKGRRTCSITFFANIGKNYAKKIIKHSPPTEIPKEPSNVNTFYLRPVNEREVFVIVQFLISRKSPGFDGIRAKFLKEIVEEIAPLLLLTMLINNIFQTSQCPNAFKKSIVTPILEKGNP